MTEKEATKRTIAALEAAQAICKENGIADPNTFIVVEVAKLWINIKSGK